MTLESCLLGRIGHRTWQIQIIARKTRAFLGYDPRVVDLRTAVRATDSHSAVRSWTPTRLHGRPEPVGRNGSPDTAGRSPATDPERFGIPYIRANTGGKFSHRDRTGRP